MDLLDRLFLAFILAPAAAFLLFALLAASLGFDAMEPKHRRIAWIVTAALPTLWLCWAIPYALFFA